MGILTLVLLLCGFHSHVRGAGVRDAGVRHGHHAGHPVRGWRTCTLGFAIYRVRPVHALGSQLTSAIVIMGASARSSPVSTTHVVATSIMGIGASERPRAVRWTKAKDIATTWVITIPGAALVSIQAYALVNLFLESSHE